MTTDQPKPRPRWLQFSLRTLFVVVTVFCIWMGFTAKRARDQRLAVEVLLELGGTVAYEHEVDGEGNIYDEIGVSFSGIIRFVPILQPIKRPAPPGPEWLRQLMGDEFFYSVAIIRLNKSQVNDLSLAAIRRLPNLNTLVLIGPEITYAELVQLEGLTNLQTLDLRFIKVTGEGVFNLQQAFPNYKIRR